MMKPMWKFRKKRNNSFVIVTTTDFMTAESYNVPWDVLGTVTSRIVNEVKHVNRVFYDCTGKPPATIELE